MLYNHEVCRILTASPAVHPLLGQPSPIRSQAGGFTKGMRERNSRGYNFRGSAVQSPASAKMPPPLDDMLGPTWARSNHLGHGLAKIAEALGISGKDNRYKEYNWADKPHAR